MEESLKYEWTTAEYVRLGDSIYADNGAVIGPVMRLEFDWKNKWATFMDTDRQEHQCFITEQLKVVRRLS